MATTKIVNVIERCEIIAQDKTSIRWPKAEWLLWYNDAILFVVNRRPDKSVKNVPFTINIADSKQALPADAISLTTVTRNLVSGKPIRQLERIQLDDQNSNWHNETGPNIDHFMYDARNPTNFYIYPRPEDVGHEVELTYTYTPVAVTISDFDTDIQTLGVDDSFLNVIIDFMLYRAYSKDADYAENGQRAISSMQAAEQAIGSKTQADSAMIPKENRNA